jgi:hypothetical protein
MVYNKKALFLWTLLSVGLAGSSDDTPGEIYKGAAH